MHFNIQDLQLFYHNIKKEYVFKYVFSHVFKYK